MKKSKLIATLLLVVILSVAMMSVFVACDRTGKDDDDPGKGNIVAPVIPPPNKDPDNNTQNQVPVYSSMEMIEKIIGAIETPEKVLGIDFEIDFTAPDGKKTIIAFKGNIYDQYRNELSFIVYQQLANDETRERVFGMYLINDKMYVDLGEGKSMLYMEDINPNYVVSLIKSGAGKLVELIGGLGDTINSFLPLIMMVLFQAPEVELTDEGGQNISMVFDIKGFLDGIPNLLGTFNLNLPVDLGPFLGYLGSLMPEGVYKIQSNYDADGKLIYLGVHIDDNVADAHTTLVVNLDIKDTAVDTYIPQIDEAALANFSLTNIQFSIDLLVGTQMEQKLDDNNNPVVDKDGKPVMVQKQLDVGKVINELLGGTGILPDTFRLPANMLLLEGGTGLRLSFALDLDLNYKKEAVDKNKIAIELFLLNQDGSLADGEGSRPQAGIYYTEGSLYVNLDNLLPNYMQNINLRVDTNLSTLISALVDMISNAIDGALGTNFKDIVDNSGATVGNDGSVTLSTQSDLERVLATANAEVLAYSSDENGKYVINAGFKNFIDALTGLIGFNKSIIVEGSQIVIIADNNLLKSVCKLIGKDFKDLGFSFPNALPAVTLTINLFEGGLDSIAVDATLDSTLDVELKIHKFLVGFEDPDLDKRIEDGINKENTSYINSLSGVVDSLLAGIILRTHFSMTFNEGRYNLAPLIASFGLSQIADTDIIWEFTEDFVLDASINIQIAFDRANPSDSTFLFELKADNGIIIGEGEEGIKFAPGTVLLGIYGYKNSIYIDLSGFKIANITLPKLKFDLQFSQIVFALIDDVISNLLTSMNIEGGDLIFNFDLGGLLGLSSAPSTDGAIATADDTGNTSTPIDQELAAIILGINADALTPMISMASILAIINQIDSTLIDETLAEALGLMEISLETSMGRKDGFKFEFNGNLIPVMIDYDDKDSICVFYYDKDGNQLPTHDENGKKIVYKNTDKEKQYAYRKYNYINKNGEDTDFRLLFEAGTADYPIVVGKIPNDQKYDFAAKAQEFEVYKSDLVQAIMDTVGTGELDLTLRLLTKDNKMDLQQMINTILASVGKRLEIPILLNLDEWETDVKLLLQWDIDLLSSARSAVKLELQYRGKIILGVYIYRNNFIINLEGLGLFSAELVNSTIITNVFGMISGFVNQIQGLDLNEIIGDLLEKAGLPTLPGAGSTEGDVATDDNMPTIGENLQVMDLVKYILGAVSLEDTSIALNFTSTLINTLLNELLGINLGIDFTLNGKLDLFGNEFGIDIGVQDIEVKASLALNIGGEVDIYVDYENIPDWDATNGRTFAKTMLDNIDIGLTIDLANNTSDARAVTSDGKAGYTRIRIWRAGNDDRLKGTDGEARVPKGQIIVGVYQIDGTLFNDNTATNGSSKPIAYVVLDYDSGKLLLTLAKNVVTFGPAIDIATWVKNIEINLDLLTTLGDMFEGLFSQLDGLFDSMNAQITSQQLATADGEDEGFGALFKDFDIVKLLSAGIEVSLRSNGNFNIDVALDPYTINKLIDDVLGAIFSRALGKESLVNLAKMAPDMFTKDHLSKVAWTRMIPGADGNLNTFWGSLRDALPDLLTDVVKGLGININIGALDGLLGGIYTQVSTIIRQLLPFAVFNEFNIGVNIVDATIANISIIGWDNNQPIYDDAGGLAYGESSARANGNFTQIWVYNMFKAVGDPSNAIPGVTGNDAQGSVTWSDIPSRIDYDPYIYESDTLGVKELFEKHFSEKKASYQDGGSGAIIKKDVTFYMKKYRANENSAWTNYSVDGNGNPNTLVSESSLSVLRTKGTYVIEARATFGTITRTMEVTINALGNGGGIESVEPISIHAYDPWPDFITAKMGDGTTRKIRTERLTFLNEEKSGAVMPETFGKDHPVNSWIRFPRKEGGSNIEKAVVINYIDSSVDQVIINGEAISAKNGSIPRLIIDLYEYNLSDESSVMDYVSDVFYFKYKDGMAVGLDVNGAWQYSQEDVNKLYNRQIDEADGLSRDVSGTAFLVTNTIGNADNNTLQEVTLMIWVKTKNVNKLTINGLENTLRIDPYQYYMYLITGDEQYNPFPTTAMANYYDAYPSPINPEENMIDNNDGVAEEVFISWNEAQYRSIDFSWNNSNAASTPVSVSLDNSKYNGNFTWTFDTQVVVMRNEVQAVYFDAELTQSTYFIDPFEYLLRKSHGESDEQIYPSQAYVMFTNGSVRQMPIQWIGLDKFYITDYSSKIGQLQVKIGYDVTGDLASKIVGDLEQTAYVNVRVENLIPDGLDVAGSEYSIRNKGEDTFYIDPIQVLYYGVDPFPDLVTMVYKNKKTSELDVDWEFDRSLITMNGRKNLVATVVISDEYRYPIKVEIIDRSNLKVAVDAIDIDPYKYTTDENGSRVYSSFGATGYIYNIVGNIDYSDLANIKVDGLKKVSGNVSEEFDTYVQYEVVYTRNSQQSVYTAKDFDLIRDFFSREGANVEIISAVAKEFFNVNVDWDLSEINYAFTDVYTVKMISKALDAKYDRSFKVNVTVKTKEVVYVSSSNYYIQITQGGTSLSEEELLTRTMKRNLYVLFKDETYGTYECTIDLSAVNLDYYVVQSVTPFEIDGETYSYRDRSGNPVADKDIAALGTDITVTVCSGDIAQRVTVKAVVVFENTQVA